MNDTQDKVVSRRVCRLAALVLFLFTIQYMAAKAEAKNKMTTTAAPSNGWGKVCQWIALVILILLGILLLGLIPLIINISKTKKKIELMEHRLAQYKEPMNTTNAPEDYSSVYDLMKSDAFNVAPKGEEKEKSGKVETTE